MAMIPVTPKFGIDEKELDIQYILSSGPGGQNVNKIASAAQLRFDITQSPSIPEDVRERFLQLFASRVTKQGEVVITARRFRTQERNREDAIARLVDLLQQAAFKPKARIKKKVSRAAKQRRLDEKRGHSEAKRRRQRVDRFSE